MKLRLFCGVSLLIVAGDFSWGNEAKAEDEDIHLLSLQVENDLFFGNTDQDYTNGIRLAYVHHPGEGGFGTGISDFLKKHLQIARTEKDVEIYYSLALGQNMYTPEDISRTDLIVNDRPYAGWTYLEFGVTAQGRNDFELLKLDVGLVGPASGAGFTQRQWHHLVGADQPEGWAHQLPNEPGLNLHYARGRRFVIDRVGSERWSFDVTPHFGAALGNIHTYGAVGATLRAGTDLNRELGAPPRIQPSLPGSDYFSGDGFDFYLFAGGEARYVVRNIFLDGTWRAHEHDVAKEKIVLDLQVGAVFFWQDWRFAITHVFRTKDHEFADGGHEYGSITVSHRF